MKFFSQDEIQIKKNENPAWYDIECAPIGLIKSAEDIKRVIEYADAHNIDARHLKKLVFNFDHYVGMEISLGSYFGGASFYYYTPSPPTWHQVNEYHNFPESKTDVIIYHNGVYCIGEYRYEDNYWLCDDGGFKAEEDDCWMYISPVPYKWRKQ